MEYRAKPKQEQSVDGKSHTGLVTIPEEVETNDVTEVHYKNHTDTGAQLKQEVDITDAIGHQNIRLILDYAEKTEEVAERDTKDTLGNMSQIDTTYVNGQEVLTAFDSCSSLTLIHHELTVTSDNSNINSSKRVINHVDRDATGNTSEDNTGQSYETWIENLLQTDGSLDDTEGDTGTLYTEKLTECELTKKEIYGQNQKALPTYSL